MRCIYKDTISVPIPTYLDIINGALDICSTDTSCFDLVTSINKVAVLFMPDGNQKRRTCIFGVKGVIADPTETANSPSSVTKLALMLNDISPAELTEIVKGIIGNV